MIKDNTYSPADVCALFGVNRTTLFRWEEQHAIPKAMREGGNRVYKQEHLRKIAALLRKKIAEEIKASSRYKPDQIHPTFEQLEKLYRLEFVSEGCQREGLQMLSALARQQELSQETRDLLIRTATSKPLGDPVRQKIWEMLTEQEKIANRSNR